MERDDTGLHVRPLPRIGQEIGRFIIEKQLPRGGQARVYRAWQTDLQRPVALKLLPSSYTADADALTRFRREIENVARISHPNIVRVFEAGEIEGNPYFTMDFIEGHDAEDMLARGAMQPDDAAAIMEAVARAVYAAHRQGIIHRDIKPGNIIVRRDGTPILTDFGLAQDLSHSGQLTQTGISMGTPAYMAPEQARGERHRVGVKSDIYSMGATLYTLLTKLRPVEGTSAYELMLKVAESRGPKWPRQAIEDVPPDLRAIVEMAMAPDPHGRYESAEAFAEDLERYLHGEWVIARSRGKLSRLWLRTRRYVPVAAVVIVALGLAAGMIYTGLNPALSGGNGLLDLGDKTLFQASKDEADEDELALLFQEGGAWSQRGGSVARGGGGELVLARAGAEPLFISPREPVCWGDFTLQSELRVRELDGPLELLIGMPESQSSHETAYRIVLGAGARDRVELKRQGRPVLSVYRPGLRALLEPDLWYRATVTRNGQSLSFSLSEVATGAQVAAFQFEDSRPAFAGMPRRRFAVAVAASELSLRAVSVAHREPRHAYELLLYSMGQFSDAELLLSLRLGLPLAEDAALSQRDTRAGLHYLRALCRERLGMLDAAAEDCARALELVASHELRARVYLLSSELATAQHDDPAALARLNAAQLSVGADREFNSRLLHAAFASAEALAEPEPERALLYYDFVTGSALGSAGLVSKALHRGALLRLALASRDPARAEILRAEAVTALERIEGGNYLRFGGVYAPAMLELYRLYRAEAEPPLEALFEVASWMTAAVGGYGVDNSILIEPLIALSWTARLSASATELAPALRAAEWIDAAARAGADAAWATALRALLSVERPELFDAEEREALWTNVREAIGEDPAHHVPAALIEFFRYGHDDEAWREEQLRRALRRDFGQQPAWWTANAGPEAFAEYCIALTRDRTEAAALLEGAANLAASGEFRLLRDRATAWLPLAR